MGLHGPHQNFALEDSALREKVINRMPVRNAIDVLFDNGAFVQCFRRIVGRCSN